MLYHIVEKFTVNVLFSEQNNANLIAKEQNQSSLKRGALRDKHFLNSEIQKNCNGRLEYKPHLLRQPKNRQALSVMSSIMRHSQTEVKTLKKVKRRGQQEKKQWYTSIRCIQRTP